MIEDEYTNLEKIHIISKTIYDFDIWEQNQNEARRSFDVPNS